MLDVLAQGLPDTLPAHPGIDPSVPHAPKRVHGLNASEIKQALANALRYFDSKHHAVLAKEFLQELDDYGHIYMYRFRPVSYDMKAYNISEYPCRTRQSACVMLLIMNNLNPAVAQFPHELITYGGNGSVFSNWAQYLITMAYLCRMTETQTLSMYSGHPMGLFPSHVDAPRVVVTNGMVIPNYSSRQEYDRMYAMGVSQYGQMTAGSYCYIGPQGIVHGTTLTILNASRKYLGTEDLSGTVYVSSGLGGMSGAQGKAAVICGAVTVVAEVNPDALYKRHHQGWIHEVVTDVHQCIERMKQAKAQRQPLSIGYLGNVVTLWEALAALDQGLVELGSDQTSLHNPYSGGYYPVQLSFQESQVMMVDNPGRFQELVHESLRRQVAAINTLTTTKGLHFWDYGNCFLLESSRAGADIMADSATTFKYPSYVEHFMGDIFSLGFGPFRWMCSSCKHQDLLVTDAIATRTLQHMLDEEPPAVIKEQIRDNLKWIMAAEDNDMVVGVQARILYSDAPGRVRLALAFNEAIATGEISAPVILSRDHHDVSGTDSPFRETSNITDGSSFCADMAVQNAIGDAARGATWVALHNGGGVGWGEVVNGGFGLVLDGSADAARRAQSMLSWDVYNGLARRAWAQHPNAKLATARGEATLSGLELTRACTVDPLLLSKVFLD